VAAALGLVALLGVAASLPPALREPGPLSPRIASYQISATLDPRTHVVSGRERLTWRNTQAEPATELKLHLYMNAFKNEESVFMREAAAGEGRLLGAPERWGFIDVTSIRLGTQELKSAARIARCAEDEADRPGCPRDETVMDLPLPAPVAPGASVVLELDFTVQLPAIIERTGYAGTFHLVGQWFPKVGVFEAAPGGGARWNCHAFHANSEFFADYGEYVVEITAPRDHLVGATGVLAEMRDAPGGLLTHVFHAEDVHDFAFAADPAFREHRERWGDVDVTLLYHPGSAAGVARDLGAVRAMKDLLERVAFPYPYRAITIVEPPVYGINAGGMEYPTLITTVPAFTPARTRLLEETAAHEFGHQYFYGLVASNEFEEAWLDEGLTTYVTSVLFDDLYGRDRSSFDLFGLRSSRVQVDRRSVATRPAADPLETFSWRFAPGSYWQVYAKTSVALHTLEAHLGRERLLAALGAYARAYRFKHPRAEDFFRAMSAASGEDLSWFFRPAFLGTAVLDYEVSALASARREPARGLFDRDGKRLEVKQQRPAAPAVYDTEVMVRRRGDFVFPVDLEVRFRDGAVERARWDGRDQYRRFAFSRPAPATAARIDPAGQVLLDADLLNNGMNARRDRAPARRVHQGLAFLVQNALQLVGF
jgi:hypothetical protein